MQLKFKEFLAFGSFIGWFINYMKFKKVWAKWLFGLVCIGSIVFIIFSHESEGGGVVQNAAPSGSNSTAVNMSATASGSNSPVNQIGTGSSNFQSQVTVNGGNVQLGNGNTQLINQPPPPSIESAELVSQSESGGLWTTVVKVMIINIRDTRSKLHYGGPPGTQTTGKIVQAATSIIAGTGEIIPFQIALFTNVSPRAISKDEIHVSIINPP